MYTNTNSKLERLVGRSSNGSNDENQTTNHEDSHVEKADSHRHDGREVLVGWDDVEVGRVLTP